MTALQGDLCGRLPDGTVWSGCRVGPERQEPEHRFPGGRGVSKTPEGKAGGNATGGADSTGVGPSPPAIPAASLANVRVAFRKAGTVPALSMPWPNPAHLTGVSVMWVAAFPSKVFWPAMDWAVALLAAAALVCRLVPNAVADDAEHEAADWRY